MALFRKFFYRKPPDGLLEISERVYVFDCCFTTDVPQEDEYKVYIGGIVNQLSDHFPDAAFMVFNFREGEQQSKIARILSEYDMTVMDYPRQYEGCPLLTMEVIHHFLRSSESWLSLGQQNILLMHCDRGGWPVLAFMLAALLIYRKNYVGEQKTLDLIYKQAPSELLQLMSPLNPLPSQMRYLQYVSRRNVGSEWPPLDRALTLDCIIIRFIPDFDGECGCRPIFRIYGQDPFMAADRTPKVLFSTPKKSNLVRYYKQTDCEIVKIDIHCYIQGDVVLECISLNSDLEREQMMFRFMFNTAFIRSNILMLNRDEIDLLWGIKDQFPKDFRVEVLFSEMDVKSPLVPIELPHIEEKEGLPVEAFAKVQEIFSSLDWVESKSDVEDVLQQITVSNFLQENVETAGSPESAEKLLQQHDPEKLKLEQKAFLGNDMKSAVSASQEYQPSLSTEHPEDENFNKKKIEPKDLQIALLRPSQSKILSQQVPHNYRSAPLSLCNSFQSLPSPISRYHSAPSALGITALLHDHAAPATKEPYCSGTVSMTISGPVPSIAKVPNSTENSALQVTQSLPTVQQSPLSGEVSMAASPSKEKTTAPSQHHHVPFSNSKSTPSVLGQHSESTSHPPSPIKEKTADSHHHLMLFSHSKSTQHSESTPSLGHQESIVLSHPPSAHSLWGDINSSLSVPGSQSSTPSLGGSLTSSSNCSSLNPPPSPPAPPPPLQQPFPSSYNDSSSSANHPPPPTPSGSFQTSTVKDFSTTPSVPTPLPPSTGRPPSEKVLTSVALTSVATSVSPPPIPSTTVMRRADTSIHPRPRPPVNADFASGPSVTSPIPPPPPPPSPSIIFPVPSPPPRLTSGTSIISLVRPPEPPPPPLPGTSVLSSVPPPPPPPGTSILSSVPPPPPPLTSVASVISPAHQPPPPPPPGQSFVSLVPPPPPLPVQSSSNPMVKSSVPLPPPPPACPANHTKAPSVHPPPLPNGFSTSGGVSHSGVCNGNVPPIPGLPSGALFTAKGRGMSRTNPKNQARRSNLKPYHWLKLTRAMQGSLWAEAQKPDEASKAPEFDMLELESLFSAAAPSSEPGSKGGKNRRASGPKSERVQLIELRRANNCEIMLTKVKVPLPELMGSALALDETALDVDQVENLIKFCPTKEEMDLLKGYNGDKANLGKCELFFLELMKVPRVESKLRVFAFKIQFQTQVSELRRSLNIVNSASEEIRNSVKLKRIMQTILSLGNALNHGTARGSAIGFRLDSLLKLTDTRARNSRITLMHYLCKVLAEKLPELLDFSQDLLSLEASTKMQLKLLAEEMQAINKGLEKVVQELTAAENDGAVSEIFCKTLKEFLSFAEAEVRSLASLYSNVGRSADALALYFGEDPARCPFEQVVSTLLNFVRMFKRSHEENCKQLEIERKKAEKEAENEQLKLATKNEAEQVIRTPIKSSPVN